MKRMRSMMIAAASLLMTSACMGPMGHGGSGDGDTSRARDTRGGTYHVQYTPNPDPIPMNEPFELSVTVAEGANHATMVSDATVTVEANMPSHGHGMNTTPTVTSEGNGAYRVRGMQFHMSGDWEVKVGVARGGSTDDVTFTIPCCDG